MGTATSQNPPQPQTMARIFSWATDFYRWARRTRIHPGGGLRATQTDSGTILSTIPDGAPIGCVQPTFIDLYGDVIMDGRHVYLMRAVKDRGWLPCDGSTVTVSDYPDLAYALGIDSGDVTFTLPDLRGRMLMGRDASSPPPAHSDAYSLGDVGGYRRHGQTENNHHDHAWTIDLAHTHSVPAPSSTTICADTATGDPPSCGVGSPIQVPDYTGTDGETGPPTYTPGIIEGFDLVGVGTVTRGNAPANDQVIIRAKHFGDDGDGSPTTPGEGAELDDVDNRPPYIVCNWIIKAV